MTDWAVDCLGGHIEGTEFPLTAEGFEGRGSVKLTRLREVAGHAQIVYFQGKTRFLFDLSFEVVWVADVAEKKFKGRIDVSDVVQDCDEDDILMNAPFNPKTDAHAAAKELFTADGPVKASLMDSIRAFQSEFVGLTEHGIAEHRNTGGTGVRSKRRVDLNKKAAEQEESQEAARQAAQQQASLAEMAKSNPNCKVTM